MKLLVALAFGVALSAQPPLNDTAPRSPAHGASLPGTCTGSDEMFYLIGSGLYSCTAVNTWTPVGLAGLPQATSAQYGAVDDAVFIADATMTASSPVLNTAHVFPLSWVGKPCTVGGSGVTSGSPSFAFNLETTIASINGSGVATLAVNAGTTTPTAVSTTGTASAGSTFLTVASSSGILQGTAVIGTNIPAGTVEVGPIVSGATVIQISKAATGTVSGTVTFSQWAMCGTDNSAAFAAVRAATNGFGFQITPTGTGTGIFLSKNDANGAGLYLTDGWSGAVIFNGGAELKCTTPEVAIAASLGCLAALEAHDVWIWHPKVGFAGISSMPKTTGNNAILIKQSSNIIIDDAYVTGAGGTGIVDFENINAHFLGTSLIQNASTNAFYSASSQDTELTSAVVDGSGDYCAEIDTLTSDPTPTGFTGGHLKCRNVWGGLMFDSKQQGSFEQVEVQNTCYGAVSINHTQGPGGTGINVGNVVYNGLGTLTSPLMPGCTTLTGNGFALYALDAVAYVGSMLYAGTGGGTQGTYCMLLNLNPHIEVDGFSDSNCTGEILVENNPYVKLSHIHADGMTGQVIVSSNAQLIADQWDFLNICTGNSCSGTGILFTGNTQFNAVNILLNDNQATPTGYNVTSTGTVDPSTIDILRGYIPHGSSTSPTTTLDGNTTLH